MILTDYYCLEKVPGQKSVYRRDCTLSTHSYPAFEQLRNKQGALFMYLTDVPDNFNKGVKKRAAKSLTKVKNISSLYTHDITKSIVYGDVIGTNDALIAVHDAEYDIIEIMIARGHKNNRVPLYNYFVDGELVDEVNRLKELAGPKGK